MTEDQSQSADAQPAAEPGALSEEELRAAYEAELSRITSAEVVLQSVVSLLNIGAHRLGLTSSGQDGIDLEQVRDAIDAVRALLPLIERRAPRELAPLRDALSQLQLAYARHIEQPTQATSSGDQQAQPSSEPGDGGASGPQTGSPDSAQQSGQPGPAETSGRLWVPGR
jgi:hypothetical protein